VPLIISTAAVWSIIILIGPFGYSFHWAYVVDTPLNQVAVAVVPIAGLIIGAASIKKKTVTRWLTVPIFLFNFLLTIIVTFALVVSVI
jgi:hypothetical protein